MRARRSAMAWVLQVPPGHPRRACSARMGEDEIRREFEILREELTAAVRRRMRRPRQAEVEEAMRVLEEFLARAERISLEGHPAATER